MATPEEFFARMLPYARKVSERTGIDPRVIIAQAALETGYGKSAPNNNYFGIKSTGQGGQTLPTTEYVNGKPVQMDQSFRTYGDMGQSAEDYGSFILKNPRYADVLSATGLDEQIAALGKSGYATDPNYAAKLKNIAGKINLNAPQNIASDTMTALGRGTDRAKLPQNSGTMMSGLLDASTNRQEKKMGLLDQLGIQKRDPNAQGDAARPFYQRDQFKNAMGDLALAFNTLRMNPDQNLAASVAAGQEKRVSAQNKNKTVAWLRSQGRDDLANAVESGSLTAPEAANVLFTAPKDARTSQIKNYEYWISQGLPAEQARLMAQSGTNINMPGAAPTPNAQGQILVPDPNNPDNPSGFKYVNVPGSKSEVEAQAAAEVASKGEQVKQVQSTVLTEDIDRLVKMIPSSGIFDLPQAGIIGSALGSMGINQEAVNVKNLLSGVQGQVAFSRLQQMRDASKTGGALGAISEKELDLLISAYGAIQQSTGPDILIENLNRIKNLMLKIENDPVASRAYYNSGGASNSTPAAGGFAVTGKI